MSEEIELTEQEVSVFAEIDNRARVAIQAAMVEAAKPFDNQVAGAAMMLCTTRGLTGAYKLSPDRKRLIKQEA